MAICKHIKRCKKLEKTCAVFLDFAKTFDTVKHDILLRKLEHYGIRGKFRWSGSSYTLENQETMC